MPLGSSAPLPAWHRMVRKLLRTIQCIGLCLPWHGNFRHRRRKKKLPSHQELIHDMNTFNRQEEEAEDSPLGCDEEGAEDAEAPRRRV